MSGIDYSTLLQYILYGWLITILLISSVTDLYSRRIPNIVTLPTILIAPCFHSLLGGVDGFLFSLGGAAAGFALLLIPYLLGGMGAGDVKLMCATGAVLGFSQSVVCSLFIGMLGGIIALGIIAYRRNLIYTLKKIFHSILYLFLVKDASLLKIDKNETAREGIPYGLAITGGVFLFFSYLVLTRDTFIIFPVF